MNPTTELLGRYRIEEDIASGGMGAVFAATDTRLGRRVAVKLLRDDLGSDPGFVERFRREAMAAAALSHPNIATIFDYGQDGSRRFIVMELVHGRDLGTLLRAEGKLGADRSAHIAAQIADALAFAHASGIVHRDIKPGNVMIQDEDRVKVTDFGIARASGDASLTAVGSILGTVHYMSPEQARGDTIGAATDIYSLGVVLYEMLVGAVPFTSDSPVSVALRHVSEEIPLPSEAEPGVSPELDGIVQRATAKDPRDRFATAGELADALRQPRVSGDPATIPLPAAPSRDGDSSVITKQTDALPATTRTLDRRPLWAWAIAAGLMVIAGLWVAAAGRDPGPSGGSSTTSQHAPNLHRTIPAIGGLSLSDATAKLTARQLVPREHLVSNPAPEGIALYTNPAAGRVVKKGTTIALYVSSGPPATPAKPGPKPKPHHEHGHGPKKDNKKENHGKHHGKDKHP